tara:strand:- start:32 stop:259 length:228 start_codon:yes stop_codon:yes gene_type:complete
MSNEEETAKWDDRNEEETRARLELAKHDLECAMRDLPGYEQDYNTARYRVDRLTGRVELIELELELIEEGRNETV